MIRALLIGGSALALSACTTATSFAPPPVEISYGGDGTDFACPAGGRSKTPVPIDRNLKGTYKLIDTFVAAIRCSAHASANGRQAFEVPAFLATTGAAAAVALGGGATYGVLGTVGNAMFNAGNKYWDPKLKAGIYDHALDALLCIKTESVGIAHYDTDPPAKDDKDINALALKVDNPPATIEVPVQEQYFMMVSAAVFSVERVLAQRLSNMGAVDASAVTAEIQKAGEARAAAEEERKKKKEAATQAAAAGNKGNDKNAFYGLNIFGEAKLPKEEVVKLDLAVLRPKLDECVIRAKL
jgi:hypothetical protein